MTGSDTAVTPARTARAGALLGLLALGGAGIAAARSPKARAIRSAAPGLRNPALVLAPSIGGPAALRVARRVLGLVRTPAGEGVTVTRHAVDGGLDAYAYTPDAPNGGALIWIHGGGTIFGAPEQDHVLCGAMARATGVTVLSVRYRLAPEHPFPAAHDDCYAALQWLVRHAERFGIDPKRIGVGGASAGGGLTAGVVQRAVDEGVPVAFQLLVYPMLDDRTTTRPVDHRGLLVWTRRSNAFAWDAYAGPDHARRELPAYAAPARRADLAGLPPTWIGVGELDLFHDEDVDYARRLVAAGVPTELRVEPGMYHAADIIAFTAPAMKAFSRDLTEALARALAPRA